MNDTLRIIHDVDLAFLTAEKARMAVESAKAVLELTRQESEAARSRLEEALSKAEESGLPRTKLRKVAEERASALLTSGLLREDAAAPEKSVPKVTKKSPRKAKPSDTESLDVSPVSASISDAEWIDDQVASEVVAEAEA